MIYLIGSSIIKKWNFPLNSINLGIGRLLTNQLQSLILPKINVNDSIVFYCGGNDIRKQFDIEYTYNNIVLFLSLLNCQDIYVISIVKCKKIYDIGRNIDTDLLNDKLRKLCLNNGYHYIESNLIFDYCLIDNECNLCKEDGVHLQNEGYDKLEELIAISK